jgi:hypothetical protein
MANPPRKKGTAAETELKRRIEAVLGSDTCTRMPAGTTFDLRVYGAAGDPPIEVLATRPDRGQWLVTLRLDDLLQLYWDAPYVNDMHVEVKRYRRFSLHTIFEGKFGGKR